MLWLGLHTPNDTPYIARKTVGWDTHYVQHDPRQRTIAGNVATARFCEHFVDAIQASKERKFMNYC